MSDKKACEVCRRPICCTAKTRKRCQMKGGECHGGGGCTSLGYERLAAILTPEVLRLIEAGRRMLAARDGWIKRGRVSAYWDAKDALLNAALALPFEKPAECNHTETQQLPKKGGE